MKKLIRSSREINEQVVDNTRMLYRPTVESLIAQITLRNSGDFVGQAIYLPGDHDWVLGKDNEDVPILVPLHRDN